MNRRLVHIAAVSALTMYCFSATAAMLADQAEATVRAMLDSGASASEIITALVEDGRSLEGATVTAVVSTQGGTRIDMAEAGICAAEDITQAESVGRAAVNVVDQSFQVESIERLMAGYAAGDCRVASTRLKTSPASYETKNTPSGGSSVSTSN